MQPMRPATRCARPPAAAACSRLRSLGCPDSGSPPWLAGPRAGSDCAPGHARATAPGVPAPLRQRLGWRASVVAIANRPCAHSLPTHVPGQAHGRPGKRSPRLRRQAVRPGAHTRRARPGRGHTARKPTTAAGRKQTTPVARRVVVAGWSESSQCAFCPASLARVSRSCTTVSSIRPSASTSDAAAARP